MKHPQIIVTFSPAGGLQAEIPGPNGSRQVIPLPPDQCHAALTRLLKGQALEAAAEAWAIMQAHTRHKSYEDQLDQLSELKFKKAKAKYQLVESQVGLLPQIKTTKSGKASTTKVKNYASSALRAAFASL